MKAIFLICFLFTAFLMQAQPLVPFPADRQIQNRAWAVATLLSIPQDAVCLTYDDSQSDSAQISDTCFARAELAYRDQDYEKALKYYKQSVVADTALRCKAYPRMARIHFAFGTVALGNADYEISAFNYKVAVTYDATLAQDISAVFRNIQKHPILYTTLSVVPGLGQLANGKTIKGTLLFSLFSFCMLEGNYLKNKYTSGRDLTGSNPVVYINNLSKVCYGIAVATVIYSMFDSYMDITAFNRMFSIKAGEQHAMAGPRSFQSLFSLNIAL